MEGVWGEMFLYVNEDGVTPVVACPRGYVSAVGGVELLESVLDLLYGGEAVAGNVVEGVVVDAGGVLVVVGLV